MSSSHPWQATRRDHPWRFGLTWFVLFGLAPIAWRATQHAALRPFDSIVTGLFVAGAALLVTSGPAPLAHRPQWNRLTAWSRDHPFLDSACLIPLLFVALVAWGRYGLVADLVIALVAWIVLLPLVARKQRRRALRHDP